MRIRLLWLVLLLALAPAATAQTIAGPGALTRQDPRLPVAMKALAERVLQADPGAAPNERAMLQLAAGRYAEAAATFADLGAAKRASDPARLLALRWEIYARARAGETAHGGFAPSFRAAAGEALAMLDDMTAYRAIYALTTPLFVFDGALDADLKADAGETQIPLTQAITLARDWAADEAFHAFAPQMPAVSEADDRRRYEVALDIPVRTPDGATVCAYVVRPKAAKRLPSLLEFTVYADRTVNLDDARLTAAHGYAAVEGFTRGKACSPDKPQPIEHDGADADVLIDWIAAQPWSDGQVGMYGGSYNGFTQWAAAKHRPKALKALMPAVSFSPGTDFPMEGGVFTTYALPWPLYTTDNKALDDATYYDTARWAGLQRTWYLSGRPYRDLTRMDGQPNPIFDGWLKHPDFDAYWRGLVPSDEELRRLDIPVLTTTGYYDSGEIGALSYLLRRERLNPRAEQYVVIGPYEHHTGQLGTISPLGSTRPEIRGLKLDPTAQLDILSLRYAWFDYVLKGAPKPAILKDRVDYELMGADRWASAPSIARLGQPGRTFYLAPDMSLAAAPKGGSAAVQTLDLKARSDVDRFPPAGDWIDQTGDDWPIVTSKVPLAHSLVWTSAPFKAADDVAGLFSVDLDFTANKRDFDLDVTLFELTPEGKFVQLSYLWQRMSYARDRTQRHLLVPGRRTRVHLTAGRLTGVRFQPGSRLVVALSLIKQPDEQINYGTGKPVSDETIADAGAPLKIRWFGDSRIELPVVR